MFLRRRNVAEDEDERSTRASRPAREKERQEADWQRVHGKAVRLTRKRPDDHLSSILASLREINLPRADPGRYYRKRSVASSVASSVLGRFGIDPDDPLFHPDIVNGEHTATAGSPIRYLQSLIRKDTTAIVELGSGWSSNLFQLYIAHGQTRSRTISFYGGEYTQAGREAADVLARHDRSIDYTSFPFDYRQPEISVVPPQSGHVLVFTVHSVEQVDRIDPGLFAQLRALGADITLVHFEPVGWQRDAKLRARRDADDEAYFRKVGTRIASGRMPGVEVAGAWWSWRRNYNRDLLPILEGLQRDGMLTEVRRAYDFGGAANILNPTTLLHYQFAHR